MLSLALDPGESNFSGSCIRILATVIEDPARVAGMAVHRKELPDEAFHRFLPFIMRESTKERNFVRKAIGWALRGFGQRNVQWRKVAVAEAMARKVSRAVRWIAKDALRERRTPR